ncbi:MAG: AI-2E family transporter [Cyclobacteriaceae bacterium]|nr:AI-2E family transporter [Cyclobacteriaceae bacterium]
MNKDPFYKKISFNLLSIGLICAALILAKDLILPILFAILLATLLLPATKYLCNKNFSRTVSILVPLIIAIIIGGSVLFILSKQVANFMADVPTLKARLNDVFSSLQHWFNDQTHITVRKQNQYIDQTIDNLKEKAPHIASLTVGSITDILTYIVLLPIYTFLILYYRSVIKTFIVGIFKNGTEKNVIDILNESTSISQKYVSGLMIETVIVFVLNSIGFLIIGVKYAIFMALLAALLNLIPYVGMLTANIICMLITLVCCNDTNTGQVIWVGIVLFVVQIIDNNLGMPLIVGNKVRINALVTIIGVLVGGKLCGIPGMFLAIPILAVLKVIFDKVPELKPWGGLLGDGTRVLKK